jgi:molybdenum-dependent DNA-binding transcriptional regulator ModE
MEPDVSLRNTKSEILSAYEEMLKKVQEKKTEEPKKVQEQQKQDNLVKKAASFSNENIVKGIAGLKVDLSSTLDKLGENLVSEFRKFEELQQAILIEQKNLEDLYKLSAVSDSLSAMLLAQKEKKEQFEHEMDSRKTEFEESMKSDSERFDTERGV